MRRAAFPYILVGGSGCVSHMCNLHVVPFWMDDIFCCSRTMIDNPEKELHTQYRFRERSGEGLMDEP